MGRSHTISLDDLREHLNDAKERISLEKKRILDLYPLPENFNREEYAFDYIRAERLGMRIINRKLADIAWLPMQLDPDGELLGSGGHQSLKRWLTSAVAGKPDSEKFGNDFIHALARGGLKLGWNAPELMRIALRIGDLFRDLSCLIGLLYYCTWLAENHVVEDIELSDPDDLTRSAEELATLVQSPHLYRILRAKEQDIERTQMESRQSHGTTGRKKARPHLRVITNDDAPNTCRTDPLPV